MEQSEFNFGPDKKPENQNEDQPTVESLGFENLQMLYQDKVGVDPKYRNLNRGELIRGIQDPEAEKARLKEIDDEDDRADLGSTRAGR